MFFTIKCGFVNIETQSSMSIGFEVGKFYRFMLHHKSCIVLVIMSAILNFKPDSKNVLAEVLLNKKKKPELAKVYAKKL